MLRCTPSDGGLHVRRARRLRTHLRIPRCQKPAATPPNVAVIASRLEDAPGELVDASELSGAGGSEPRGAERMCWEPGLAALAEHGRTASGACTDAGIGILGWCVLLEFPERQILEFATRFAISPRFGWGGEVMGGHDRSR